MDEEDQNQEEEVNKWLLETNNTTIHKFIDSKDLTNRMEVAADLLSGMKERPKTQSLIYKSTGSKVASVVLKGTMVFGRSDEADFVLDSTVVSRKHFEIVCEGKNAFLRDLDSANGVKINGSDIKEKWLVDGDMIEVRPYNFMFINPLED